MRARVLVVSTGNGRDDDQEEDEVGAGTPVDMTGRARGPQPVPLERTPFGDSASPAEGKGRSGTRRGAGAIDFQEMMQQAMM